MELLRENAAGTEKTGENQSGTKKHTVDKLLFLQLLLMKLFIL